MDSPPPLQPVHLSVSIVLHNSDLDMLQRALKSLQASVGVAVEAGMLRKVSVYLVDNASAESYQEELGLLVKNWRQSDTFTLACEWLGRNCGFGGGHNRAIGGLVSDYHLVLNPDVELEPDTLSVGLSVLENSEEVVLVSPKVYGGEGDQEFLCKRYPSVLVLLIRGFAPRFLHRLFRRPLAVYEMRDVCSGDSPVDVAIASGCFMLMPTAVLQEEGGFNEQFFLYFEDFDLSLRLENRGRLVFQPSMQIVHHGGYAAQKGWMHLRYFVSSGVRFFNCHGWRWI